MRAKYVLLSALVITLLLTTWLRFYRIDHQSYWNDEGNSLGLARRDVATIVRSAAADIHPPGYYLALKAWSALAGNSELALRGFSALAGIVLAALLYRLGKEYFGPWAGLAAALVGASNPFLIYYAQEARMYALLATLGAASFLLFSLWLRSSRPPAPPLGDWRLGLAFSLVTAAGLFTHYAFGFIVLAQNVAALGGLLAHRGARSQPARTGRQRATPHRSRPEPPLPGAAAARPAWQMRFLAWVGWQALALALYLPWLPTALRQLTTWPAEREFQTAGAALVELGRYLVFGRTLPTAAALAGLAGAAVVLLFGLARRGPGRRGQTITPLLWLLVPAALTLGFGLLSEPFAKFLLVAVPAVCLLLGQGLAARPALGRTEPAPTSDQRRGQRASHTPRERTAAAPRPANASLRKAAALTLWLAAVLALAAGTFASLNNLYFNPAYFRDDYRGIAAYVAALARPGDALITIAPNQVEALGYYHRAGAPVYPLPHSRPLDVAEAEAALATITAQHARLFVLYWGDARADPEHRVEQWLNTQTFKAGEAWFGQVRLATYAAAAPASTPSVLSGAQFGRPNGSPIVLEGHALPPGALAPGDILQVTLFWRTDAPIEERYKVFVHLYTDTGQPPAAQQDGEPGGGLSPTTDWPVGATVRDNHGVLLPAELAAGEYTLSIGLYDLFTNARLPVTGPGAAGDRLDLGTVTIR